jgi:hypothetical protein
VSSVESSGEQTARSCILFLVFQRLRDQAAHIPEKEPWRIQVVVDSSKMTTNPFFRHSSPCGLSKPWLLPWFAIAFTSNMKIFDSATLPRMADFGMAMAPAATAAATNSSGWKWHQQFPETSSFTEKSKTAEPQQRVHHIEPRNLSELLSPVDANNMATKMDVDAESEAGPSPRTVTKPSIHIPDPDSAACPEPQDRATPETSTAERRITTADLSQADKMEPVSPQDPLRRPSAPSAKSQEATHANILHLRERLRGWGLFFLRDHRSVDAMIQAVSISPKTPVLTPKEEEPVVKAEPVSSDEERMLWEGTVRDKAQASQDMLEMNAIVWPHDGKRKRFLIQRTFNVAELRASIPDPSARSSRRFSLPVMTRLVTRQSVTRAKKIMASPVGSVGGPFSPLSPSSPITPLSTTARPGATPSLPQRRALPGEAQARSHPFLNNAQPIRKPVNPSPAGSRRRFTVPC